VCFYNFGAEIKYLQSFPGKTKSGKTGVGVAEGQE